MGIKSDTERGRRRSFTLRVGVNDFPGFRGIQKQADPGAISPDQFEHLENARITGGDVVSRGGQSKYMTTPVSGCVMGIFSTEQDDTFGGGSGGGPSWDGLYTNITVAGAEKLARFNLGVGWESIYDIMGGDGTQFGIAFFSGTKGYLVRYVGGLGGLTSVYSFNLPVAAGGLAPLTHLFDLGPSEDSTKTVHAADVIPGSALQFYFFAVSNAANTLSSKIYTWNGAALVADKDTGLASGSSIGEVNLVVGGAGNNEVFAAIKGEANSGLPRPAAILRLLHRNAAGAWNTVDAPTQVTPSAGRGAFYGGKYYFGANCFTTLITGRGVASWDGAAGDITLHDPGFASPLLWFVVDTFVFNGYLYYVWINPAGVTGLGRFNGTTWEDTVFSGAPLGGVFYPDDTSGNLYCVSRLGGSAGVWQSNGPDVTSWTQIDATVITGFDGIFGLNRPKAF